MGIRSSLLAGQWATYGWVRAPDERPEVARRAQRGSPAHQARRRGEPGYVIKDGRIQRAPGTRLTVIDPWAAFDDWRARSIPPWIELIRIADVKDPTVRSERIVEWCSEYGLLGLLPHRLAGVIFPPRWRHRTQEQMLIAPAGMYPCSESFSYVAGRWSHVVEPVIAAGPADQTRLLRRDDGSMEEGAGVNVNADAPMEARFATPAALLRTSWGAITTAHPTAFSSVYLPHALEIPLPLSRPFFAAYGEPEINFLSEVIQLRRAFTRAAKDRSDTSGFDAFIVGVHPRTVPGEDGRVSVQWVTPSMLATMAMMMVLSLGERWPFICGHCGLPGLGTKSDATYCQGKDGKPSKCKMAGTKAQYRKIQKGASDAEA